MWTLALAPCWAWIVTGSEIAMGCGTLAKRPRGVDCVHSQNELPGAFAQATSHRLPTTSCPLSERCIAESSLWDRKAQQRIAHDHHRSLLCQWARKSNRANLILLCHSEWNVEVLNQWARQSSYLRATISSATNTTRHCSAPACGRHERPFFLLICALPWPLYFFAQRQR